MIILTFQYVCRINEQHVFAKFAIIREFYNGKNTFTRTVLQWEIEICCFNNSHSQIIHVSTIYEIHIAYSNTEYHIRLLPLFCLIFFVEC